MNTVLPLAVTLTLLLALSASARDVFNDTWVCTDGLNRTLATGETVGGPREGKTVGMFYWLWHYASAHVEPVNIQGVLDEHPEAIDDPNHPAWGPPYAYHWWNEPLLGFYRNTDEWVVRKHGEMLADMGVDVIIIDATNGEITWEEGYKTLFRVWSEARADGVDTPKVAFMCAFGPVNNIVQKLYDELYSKGIGEEHWFYWKGKPLIMAYPDNVGGPAASFFTFRPGQPLYNTGPVRDDQWGWLEIHPQHGFVETEDGGYEQVTVGVAQNYSEMKNGGNTSQFTWPGSFGRSYHRGHQDPDPAAMLYGRNFQEQWERGLELDPEFIFITGFNEWVAMRFPPEDKYWGGQPVGFVDQFDNDRSRDLEPTKGRLQDHSLYQAVHGIRQYKGARTPCGPSEPKTIRVGAGPEQWRDVGPEFRAHRGLLERDHPGAGDHHYVDRSARNDIITSKVCRDGDYVYFQVETAEALTDPSGENWMWLLLNSDRNPNTGWKGYEVIVNRLPMTEEGVSVERWIGGDWDWDLVGRAPGSVDGRFLELGLRREWFGYAHGAPIELEFKWVDNVQDPGNILDFYVSGDAAPGGRYNYLFREHFPFVDAGEDVAADVGEGVVLSGRISPNAFGEASFGAEWSATGDGLRVEVDRDDPHRCLVMADTPGTYKVTLTVAWGPRVFADTATVVVE